jgi:hypothetical protein
VREITREADAELRDALIERVFARLSKAPRR